MDIPENWIHSPGIFPYPGNGDNKFLLKEFLLVLFLRWLSLNGYRDWMWYKSELLLLIEFALPLGSNDSKIIQLLLERTGNNWERFSVCLRVAATQRLVMASWRHREGEGLRTTTKDKRTKGNRKYNHQHPVNGQPNQHIHSPLALSPPLPLNLEPVARCVCACVSEPFITSAHHGWKSRKAILSTH